jgi:hypothetical protein
MRCQILLNGLDQIVHVVEDTPADSLLGDSAEPTLDQIEPGGTGGDEVELEPRVFLQPGAHLRVFVGAVVIQDEVQSHFLGELSV